MKKDVHFAVEYRYSELLVKFADLPDRKDTDLETAQMYQEFFDQEKWSLQHFKRIGWKLKTWFGEDWVKSKYFAELLKDKQEIRAILQLAYKAKKIKATSLKWLKDFLNRLNRNIETETIESKLKESIVFATGLTAEKGLVHDESHFNQFSEIDGTLKEIDIDQLSDEQELTLADYGIFRAGYSSGLFYGQPLHNFALILADAVIAYLRFYHQYANECQNQECSNIFIGRGKGREDKKYCRSECRNLENRRKKKTIRT